MLYYIKLSASIILCILSLNNNATMSEEKKLAINLLNNFSLVEITYNKDSDNDNFKIHFDKLRRSKLMNSGDLLRYKDKDLTRELIVEQSDIINAYIEYVPSNEYRDGVVIVIREPVNGYTVCNYEVFKDVDGNIVEKNFIGYSTAIQPVNGLYIYGTSENINSKGSPDTTVKNPESNETTIQTTVEEPTITTSEPTTTTTHNGSNTNNGNSTHTKN